MAMPALAACVSENAQRDRKANTRPGRFHELSKTQDYPARPRFRVRVGSRLWPVEEALRAPSHGQRYWLRSITMMRRGRLFWI